jgi:uncharacterized protein
MTVASPCIAQCKINDASGLCQGCWRTIEEITAWSSMDDALKNQAWLLIGHRKKIAQSAIVVQLYQGGGEAQ